MGEDRPSLVEEIIDSEFDTVADNPAEGSEVVVDNVVKEEWVVWLEHVWSHGREIGISAEETKES